MAGKYSPGDFDLVVKRSSAGLGLFANAAIPKGVCVIEYFGPTLSAAECETKQSKYLFEVSDAKTIDGSPRENTARYINHSCAPNCEPEIYRGRVFIFSKRAIKPGEELSYNYGKTYFDTYIGKNCRCSKCAAKREEAAAAR